MLKIFASLLLIFCLTSCASTNTYVMPQGAQVATLKGYYDSRGLFDWRDAHVTAIDDKEISYLQEDMIGGHKGNKIITVLPGPHTFVINAAFNRELLGNGPYEIYLELKTIVSSQQKYHLNMSVHGATIACWLEDQSGRRVSSIVSNNYHTAPKVNTVYIQPIK